jgi:hypothetical protein
MCIKTLLGDPHHCPQDTFSTLFWASGTGFSLVYQEPFMFSRLGRFTCDIVNEPILSELLSYAEQVRNYMSLFIPGAIEDMDKSDPKLFQDLVGRR